MQETAVEEQQLEPASVAPEEAPEPAQEEQPAEPPAPSATDLEVSLTDLRVTLEERDAELAQVKATLEQRDAEAEALRHQLASATARYREALLASAPEVPEELVSGATPEEVEASLAQARQMVERIRSHIEAQLAEQRVPTGAPIRSAPDLSGMSAQEKIAYALSQREGRT